MSAAGGIRTLKPFRAAGFEPALYAGSSTAACDVVEAHGSARVVAVRAYRRVTVLHSQPMSRAMVERRLTDVSTQLKELRRELAVTDEQLAHLADEADDARLRSLVSETPLAEREHREAARHAEAMGRHRSEVAGDIARLEELQDELLDKLLDTGA
jgi:chromosome segregation ATPase